MKTKQLADILERVEHWPKHAQDELAEIVRDMDAGLKNETYEPTPEELAGIDRGLRHAVQGKFATDEAVEAIFAKFRRK
jgi:predicted transcriptional regulator